MAEQTCSASCGNIAALFDKSKPVLAMISVQFGFAGMNIISKVALNAGMSHFALVMYRHAVAAITLAPFAYFLERKNRPKLTFSIFCQLFLSALLGASMNQNFYYAGLGYTTATFACALSNMLPAVTFLMAVPFGLEKLAIRSRAGQAKVAGTIVCVGGAMLLTFYKGVAINLWSSHFNLNAHHGGTKSVAKSENIVKGSLLIVASCFSYAGWFILQAKISKVYPAKYSSTAIMCFLASIQSAIITAIFERDPSVWALGWDVELFTVMYSGVVASGIAFSVMSWCISKRGPLFVTVFNPLLLVIVAIMSTFLLDERLHLGSIMGSVLIVSGLYTVVWGKRKEMEEAVKLSAKIDPQKTVNTVECISYNSRSTLSHSKEIRIEMESPAAPTLKHLTASPEENINEICPAARPSGPTSDSTTGGSVDHVTIECSGLDTENATTVETDHHSNSADPGESRNRIGS